MAAKGSTRRIPKRRYLFEQLESRVVLDAGASGGLALEPVSDAISPETYQNASGETSVPRFASAGAIQDFLIQDALDRYGHLFGQPAWHYGWWRGTEIDTLARNDLAVAADASGYSGTNVQVEGVDEGDLVKTDGRYLYIGRPEGLTIIDVRAADSPKVVARTEIVGLPDSLYLAGDRLIVISQDQPDVMPVLSVVADDWRAPRPYESVFHVTVFDVTSPDDASVIRRFEVDGRFVDSRLLGETVYLVSQTDFFLPPPVSRCQAVDPGASGTIAGASDANAGMDSAATFNLPPIEGYIGSTPCVYETQTEYLARLVGQELVIALPDYSMKDSAGQEIASGSLLSSEAIYRPPGREHDSLLTITAIDVSASPILADAAAVPAGWTSVMYMSPESLYVAAPTVLDVEGFRSGLGICQFALQGSGGGIELTAQGEVAGWLPNSFAMDEYAGHL
ncbi:MAG: beta-propeller domain-containing protein, partial [Planctomycetes bacterium]|nr:beta-propeller domain-containing protein [Planctomycetota bacterium]